MPLNVLNYFLDAQYAIILYVGLFYSTFYYIKCSARWKIMRSVASQPRHGSVIDLP